jgi:hypothetical protein
MNRDPLHDQPPPNSPGASNSRPVGADDGVKALIVSIVGLFVFAPAAIYSVLLAGEARAEAQHLDRPLDGKVKAAWIISLVALVLWAVGLLFLLILLVTGDGELSGATTLFAGLSLSVAACMVHAAANQRWNAVQGGGLVLAVFLALMVGASVR